MSNLKILITPNNVASMPSFAVEALNNIEGVEAIGLFVGGHKYVYKSANKNCINIPIVSKKKPIQYLYYKTKYFFLFIKYLIWADVVHIIWDGILPFQLELRLAKLFRKIRFIEWVGSEIRIPEIAIQISSFMKAVYENKNYEYFKIEYANADYKRQIKFAKFGFTPITYSEIDNYINKQLFSKIYFTNQRLNVFDCNPIYPSIENKIPLIVHSPTAPLFKGSKEIIEVLDSLKEKYQFEFKLITNLSREEALGYMQRCDIFIDQILCGAHGLAICEAMAFGKPSICYLSDAILNNHFPKEECPIVNANPNTLKEKLIPLLESAQLRHDIGIKSRAYAEKYHDSMVVAKNLVEIYKKEVTE